MPLGGPRPPAALTEVAVPLAGRTRASRSTSPAAPPWCEPVVLTASGVTAFAANPVDDEEHMIAA